MSRLPPYGMPCTQPPIAPCGPCQPVFGSCALNVPCPSQCANPRSLSPCCEPIMCQPPQMMVAYRKPYSSTPGKEEYICYPCFFKNPKPCHNVCCPAPTQFNPTPDDTC